MSNIFVFLTYLGKLYRCIALSCSMDLYMESLRTVPSCIRIFHIFALLYHTLRCTLQLSKYSIHNQLKMMFHLCVYLSQIESLRQRTEIIGTSFYYYLGILERYSFHPQTPRLHLNIRHPHADLLPLLF